MIHKLRGLWVPTVIAITFYLFGFFVVVNLLNLSGREIAIGLVAGTIGGLTTLTAVLLDFGAPKAKPAAEMA